MAAFLDAAYRVLKSRGVPMSARDITAEALRAGFLYTSGMTPWQTMKSKLSMDILTRKEASPFMRSAEGMFALREWGSTLPEHVADRFQRALFDEDVLVFPVDILPGFVPGIGLQRVGASASRLVRECFPMRRREAEADLSVIQLVSVFVVRAKGRVLTYKRAKRLPESRLHGYYSIAFGGHLNPDDVPSLFDISDVDQWLPWLVRELHEEVRVGGSPLMRFSGLLYDDSRPVSRQHVGIVYEVFAQDTEFQIGERGFLVDAKYEDVAEIRARIDQFENWSVLLLNALEGE